MRLQRILIPSLLLIISIISAPQTSFSQTIKKSLSGTIQLPASKNLNTRSRGGAYRSRYAISDQSKEAKKNNPYDDIVVYLTPVDGKISVEPLQPFPVLNQKNVTFIPRVLPITVGTTVSIINEDRIYHNVFSKSNIQSFDIGKRPTGVVFNQTFTKPGAIQSFCTIHPDMSTYILVLETPYFVKTDNEGFYLFENIPTGKYWLEVFHPDFTIEKRQISLKTGSPQTIDLSMR